MPPPETGKLLEEILKGKVTTVSAPTERKWLDVWSQHKLGLKSPIVSALKGGAIADRLPWVFISGYQAAIRATFPSVPAGGWAAFVATEDDGGLARYPGTRLKRTPDGMLLSGHKSWIAQSRNVSHLIVTAKESDDDDTPGSVLVSANAPGVRLTHRSRPAFLGHMSQGFGLFERVEVPGLPYGWDLTRAFGRHESRYVMLSAASFLLTHLTRAGWIDDAAVAVMLELAGLCDEPVVPAQTMAALDRRLQELVRRFVSRDIDVPDWAADQRLFSMYSSRIQRQSKRGAADG